jgi:hypothetical protein
MFRQIGTPSERDLTELMGDDYIREWDQGRVTQWLEEHGWSHIAPKFRGKLREAVHIPPCTPLSLLIVRTLYRSANLR